ncbi:MAG: M13 family peptidase, partial [Flavobacteriales bacterium]
MRSLVFCFLSLLLFDSCHRKSDAPNTADDFLAAWIDSSVAPGVDFFRFATGNWMKNNPIPDAERRWGIGNLVQEEVYAKLRSLSEEAASDAAAPAGSNRQRIGAFWSSGMDSATIESLGLEPLKKELESIDAIKDINSLRTVLARQQMIGVSPLFDMAVYQDEMNSEQFTLHLYQGGLGLPDRDYYFNNDARTKGIREEYVRHISTILNLSGFTATRAASSAQSIMKFETALAKTSRKLEDLRD